MLMAHSRVPRGISITNEKLSESVISSIADFYGSSEILSYYSYSPPFMLDTASIVERIVREALKETLTKLHNLLALDAGWNGYDALAPNADAVAHAEDWLVRLFLEVADLGRMWMKPNVIADAEGEVVFEWWYGTKKPTVYIAEQSAEYVQVWGKDIHS